MHNKVGSGIDDTRCGLLADHLPMLTRLWLRTVHDNAANNNLTSAAARSIARLKRLADLQIGDNNIGDEGAETIAWIVKLGWNL